MSDWAARVYEADCRSAELCRDMQIAGFAFDVEGAAKVSEQLKDHEQSLRRAADVAVGRPILSGKSGGFSTKDLQRAFFSDLRAPVFFRSELSGAPSLGKDALRAYAAYHDERLRALSLAVLEYRNVRLVRRMFVDAILEEIGDDGRVHPTWMNYGTVSGRWSCQGPNLMNLPRPENDPVARAGGIGIRGLYTAAPGCVLVGFDCKQLEMRVAAYASGDEAMIAACESSDLHAGNARVIFGDAFDPDEYVRLAGLADEVITPDEAVILKALKALRTLAKTSGFAVCYLAEAPTVYAKLVAEGQAPKGGLRAVEAMLSRMRKAFTRYYEWQAGRLLDCIREGWTDSPILGRRRWLGHEPPPTECANFPIQSGAADFVNARLVALVADLARGRSRARLVAQVHDSAYFEAPRNEADLVAEAAHRVFEAPIEISSSGRKLQAKFPIELKASERWH